MFGTLAKAIITGAAVTAVLRFIVTALPSGGVPHHADPVSEAIGFWMMSSVAFTVVLSPALALASWSGLRVSRAVVAAACGGGIPLMMLAFFSRNDGILNGLILNIATGSSGQASSCRSTFRSPWVERHSDTSLHRCWSE